MSNVTKILPSWSAQCTEGRVRAAQVIADLKAGKSIPAFTVDAGAALDMAPGVRAGFLAGLAFEIMGK